MGPALSVRVENSTLLTSARNLTWPQHDHDQQAVCCVAGRSAFERAAYSAGWFYAVAGSAFVWDRVTRVGWGRRAHRVERQYSERQERQFVLGELRRGVQRQTKSVWRSQLLDQRLAQPAAVRRRRLPGAVVRRRDRDHGSASALRHNRPLDLSRTFIGRLPAARNICSRWVTTRGVPWCFLAASLPAVRTAAVPRRELVVSKCLCPFGQPVRPSSTHRATRDVRWGGTAAKSFPKLTTRGVMFSRRGGRSNAEPDAAVAAIDDRRARERIGSGEANEAASYARVRQDWYDGRRKARVQSRQYIMQREAASEGIASRDCSPRNAKRDARDRVEFGDVERSYHFQEAWPIR